MTNIDTIPLIVEEMRKTIDRMRARGWDTPTGMVDAWADRLQSILSARQEVAPVGYTEEVFALARRCLFIAFAWNDHNHDPAHKLARETAERCGIKSFDQANDWLESEPATGQTSEARDAERLDFMVNRGAGIDCYKGKWSEPTVYRVTAFGSILTQWHDSYREAIDAAMRQEAE